MRGREQRRLATVLFVDVIDSTRVAAEVGDVRWRDLVRAFRAVVRRHLRQHGGHEVDTAGDGFFAWFERPASGLHAAAAIAADVQQHGLDVRCGLHTGELETIDGRLGGIAAHIGARVMSSAGAAEIFVTNTLREMVVGGDFGFETVGETELKGVPGRWALHRLTTVAGLPIADPLDSAEANRRRVPRALASRRSRRAIWAALAGATAIALVGVYLLRGVLAGPAPSASPTSSPLGAGATASAPPSGSPTTSSSPSPSPFPLSLQAINPVTNGLTEVVRDEHGSGTGADLIVANGNLWSHEWGKTLVRRDLATGAFLSKLDLPPETWGVAVAFGSIWITHNTLLPVVDKVDPLSFRTESQIKPGEQVEGATMGDVALYLLTQDSRILEYDPLSTLKIDDDPLGTATDPVFVNFRDGFLYVCECEAERFAKFDPETDQLVDLFEGARFRLGLADKEPATGTLWIRDAARHTIIPYPSEDGPPGSPIGLSGPPHHVAFGFSSVWVAAEGWVYRIASAGEDVQPIKMPADAKATSIGIDEQANRVWVSLCYGTCLQ